MEQLTLAHDVEDSLRLQLDAARATARRDAAAAAAAAAQAAEREKLLTADPEALKGMAPEVRTTV